MTAPTYLDRDHGEGYFDIDEYELYYRRFGQGDTVLLALHGGPGMPHDYLAPLARHGTSERAVYMYDQYGVGRSTQPAPGDFDSYTIDHYRGEVEAVRQTISPDTFYVYGQSWGGMLAQEYVLEYGEHVDGLILANTLADTQSAYESMRGVLENLSEEDQTKIEEYESRREFDAPEYDSLLAKAYERHFCRLDDYPQPIDYTLQNINFDVYGLMWGPNEYVLMDTARLKDWDVRDRLDTINTPTLVLTGSHDEIKPEIARDIADRIPDAQFVEFEDSSHTPFWEQSDAHYNAVETFLDTL